MTRTGLLYRLLPYQLHEAIVEWFNFWSLTSNCSCRPNDYDPEDEEDEEAIIERRRKQREELMSRLNQEQQATDSSNQETANGDTADGQEEAVDVPAEPSRSPERDPPITSFDPKRNGIRTGVKPGKRGLLFRRG